MDPLATMRPPTHSDLETATKPGTKKLYVKTYGCQMNVYDSERIADALGPLGYQPVTTPGDADLVVLNTCHIRERAADKVFSELGRLRELKAERRAGGGDMRIAVAGCVAQAEGGEILRREPDVDLVVGPQSYHRLPELLLRVQEDGRSRIETEFAAQSKFDSLPRRTPAGRGPAAFVTVQEGCDKFCTFCVVPYTRGGEISRPAEKILAEIQQLSDSGVREVTLLGQNVNAYHGVGPDDSTWSLARLISAISSVDGIARIRYMTSHPRDMSDDLMAEHRDNPKLMPFLHLPFQSGSDRILKAMNRKHTAADYLRLIDRARAMRPDIALSTDIIVGFPGESEADFQATLAVVREAGFAQGYSFKYSPRPGTPAAEMGDAIDEMATAERLEQVQTLLASQQKAFNTGCIGRTLPVLFEKPGRNPGQIIGRSPYLQSVNATGSLAVIGQIAKVAIESCGLNSIKGVLVNGNPNNINAYQGDTTWQG